VKANSTDKVSRLSLGYGQFKNQPGDFPGKFAAWRDDLSRSYEKEPGFALEWIHPRAEFFVLQ
jgi:hypothetical protein